MKALAAQWRSSPMVRALARAVVFAAATYVYTALKAGEAIDLASLGTAAAVGATGFLVGFLSPVEPFIGPKYSKPDGIEVPSPPADPEPAA